MKIILVLLVVFVGIVISAPRKATSVANACTDRHIWIADGSVDCKYLYTASFWGLHSKPSYWCNDYSLTECCATCQRLRNEGVVN